MSFRRRSGLGVDRRGNRRERRLLGGSPEGRRFGTFAGTAAAVVARGCSVHPFRRPLGRRIFGQEIAWGSRRRQGLCCLRGIIFMSFLSLRNLMRGL